MTLRITYMSIALAAVFIGLPIFLWTQEGGFAGLFGGVPALIVITGIAFAGNLTLLVPAPAFGATMPVLSRLADQNGLFLVSALYAAGSALGETSGYIVGRKGAEIPFLGNSRWHQRLERWLRGKKLRDFALIVLSGQPFIPFDVGGMIAGSIQHPWWRFVLATFLGRWLKYWAFIQIWQTTANLLVDLSGYLIWTALACVLVGLGIIALRYRKEMLKELHIRRMRIKEKGIRLELALRPAFLGGRR